MSIENDLSAFADLSVVAATNCPLDVVLIGDVPLVEDQVDWPTMIEQVRDYATGGPTPPWRMVRLEGP
jgi:hypothetical protein